LEQPDHRKILIQLVTTRMPFGKYEGKLICDLPEFYLVWYHSKGFPKGTIGVLLGTMYEIKLNGLESLLIPIKRDFGRR
jgi:uncharacterized protein (DUF3820 family)